MYVVLIFLLVLLGFWIWKVVKKQVAPNPKGSIVKRHDDIRGTSSYHLQDNSLSEVAFASQKKVLPSVRLDLTLIEGADTVLMTARVVWYMKAPVLKFWKKKGLAPSPPRKVVFRVDGELYDFGLDPHSGSIPRHLLERKGFITFECSADTSVPSSVLYKMAVASAPFRVRLEGMDCAPVEATFDSVNGSLFLSALNQIGSVD